MIRSVILNLPTLAFLTLYHLGPDRLGAALVGTFLAWAVILTGLRQPAIVRGLNLHFAVVVPTLYFMWRYGADPVVNWIETWVLATVVWMAAGSVLYDVWRRALPASMGLVAALAFGWTLVVPNDQLLTIAAPVIFLTFAARCLGRAGANLMFLAASVAADVDETAAGPVKA